MTAVAESKQAYKPSPAPAPKKINGRKTGKMWTMLAAASVALMVLVVAGLVVAARGGQVYLGLARPVAFGTKVEAADLVEIRVSAGSGLTPILASDKDSVIGQYAAMPLTAGTLLTKANLSPTAIPEGKQLITVSQKAERAPAQPLTPGAPVMVVRTPNSGSMTGSDATAPMAPVAGIVRTVRALEYGAGFSVDVLVPEADGATVAQAAAKGEVTLVGTAGR
jgi:flagella basal body P-ring formation protein FlgA